MTTLINLTPHAVKIYAADGATLLTEVPPSGTVCRVKTLPQAPAGALDIGGVAVPLVTPQKFTAEVTGLPQDPQAAILVGIVGLESVLAAHPGPVYVTDTGPASVVRDDKGAILGVRRLQDARA